MAKTKAIKTSKKTAKSSNKKTVKTSKRKTAKRKTKKVDQGYYRYPTVDGPLGDVDGSTLMRLANLYKFYAEFYKPLAAKVPEDKRVRECLSKEEVKAIYDQAKQDYRAL